MSITLFSAQLQWLNDYDEALKNAQKEHKLVYILVVSDTCKWCKKFENKTLQNKQIKERVNKEFVTVLLSRDTELFNSFMDNAQEHYEILKDNNNETSTDN